MAEKIGYAGADDFPLMDHEWCRVTRQRHPQVGPRLICPTWITEDDPLSRPGHLAAVDRFDLDNSDVNLFVRRRFQHPHRMLIYDFAGPPRSATVDVIS